MEYFRSLSKSRTVSILTAVFGVAMLIAGIDRGMGRSSGSNAQINRKAQYQFKSIVRAHWQQHGTTPDQSDLQVYQQQALHMTRVQSKLSDYFKDTGFELPPKQIAKIATRQPDLKPLLDKLNDNDPKSRADAPEQFEEIKDFIERNSFESSIANSVIIPEYNRERLRRVFMQERTYQWLEIDSSYLEKDTRINNEAEIHQYYETHSFPLKASAKIAYVRIDPASISKPSITDDKLQKLIQTGQMTLPTVTQMKATAYALTTKANDSGQKLNLTGEHTNVLGLPENLRSDQLHYQSKEVIYLPVSSLKDVTAAHFKTGSHIYQNVKGKATILEVLGVEQTTCESKTCFNDLKNRWIASQHDAAVMEKSNNLQESKLYEPKDLQKVAKDNGLKVQTSETFTPEASIHSLKSGRLIDHVFNTGIKQQGISDAVKLEDGSVVFYKVLEHTPESKAPMEAVRQDITEQLRKEHRQQQTIKDTELSIKQLHNGDSIEKIAQKFGSKIQQSKDKNILRQRLPIKVLEEADKIASPNIGWSRPILVDSPDENKWYLVALTNVLYTNIHNSAEENIVKDPELHTVLQRQELNSLYQEILA